MNLAAERRRRLTHRAVPALAGVAVVALGAGLALGAGATSDAERTATAFGEAWERRDYGGMRALLTPASRARAGRAEFAAAYRDAADTATATSVEVGDPRGEEGDAVILPVVATTRVFGTVRGELRLPVSDDGVTWAPYLAFPGLGPGVALRRRTIPPERGTLLAVRGAVLARGPAEARGSPAGDVASSIAGSLGPETTAEGREALYARGFPRDWPVGTSGLERVFERRLAGRPGGQLLAGARVLASAGARPAPPVRTTIDLDLQEAAVTALAGRFGGIAALDARSGEVRALAGIAFSAPQPPGSTFKIVTATAALEERVVRPSTEFPVESAAIIDGVELENANGELCGGSFQNSFAHSCNSVFAPLGVEVGAERLVATAERYGWNELPDLAGEAASTLPPANDIVSPLDVGSTAIGQGRVLATPLQLASVAQTISADGVRARPTLAAGARPRRMRVTSRRVARQIERMMVDVVAYGTGIAAGIPDVPVAGKTGTAELEDTRGPNAPEEPDPNNTNAWFTAYAPADDPRVAVAVMLVRGGAGGATAAPAARLVLEAGLAGQGR